jgi:methionyl-tRNA synthetase
MGDPRVKMFYLTTPIYYINDVPHIGHAYTTILADVLARYHRLLGEEVFFLTGTDEHGQKVETAARQRGVGTQEHVDSMADAWRASFARLGLSFDRFIRTTEPEHVEVVSRVLQRVWDAGDVYAAPYVGWYCVPDERFWTEKDLVNGRCPTCGREVQRLEETNYFFRMSRYQDWLIGHIRENPDFIVPETRKNEILGFLAQPLNDLCISRPRARLAWGIPLPWDADYVAYVWVDALINYVTGAGFLQGEDVFARRWPADLHLIGKDILTTHSVYWPTLLRSAGIGPPRRIAAHGWWLHDAQKMSKSLGNSISPETLVEDLGVDAVRYYLMREMVFGQDANFTSEGMVTRLNTELANDLGNLLSRVVNMVGRYAGGTVPELAAASLEPSRELRSLAEEVPERVVDAVLRLEVSRAMHEAMELVRATNRYLERIAPWKVAKTGAFGVGETARANLEGSPAPANPGRSASPAGQPPTGEQVVRECLAHAAEVLRVALVLLSPVVPGMAVRGLAALGVAPEGLPSADGRRSAAAAGRGTRAAAGEAGPGVPRIPEAGWGAVPCGATALAEPLFRRIDEATSLRV